ncbi:hypothetical protein D915_009895 [Fasciola hepatica]|uniref:Apple domain-containing protein n=1 Tax=Fasciola hepatica TaxID=6192 RepID=A0A4E0R0L2_FASHE|nr:hypothetical protein D915_009895 [Fasciola hepatica]
MQAHFQVIHIIAALLFRLYVTESLTFAPNKEYFTKIAMFCDAHRECFERGQSKKMIGYMIGKEYTELNALQSITSDIWLNYNALLHQKNTDRADRWIFGETLNDSSRNVYRNYIKPKHSEATRNSVYTSASWIEPTNSGDDRKPFACGYHHLQTRNLELSLERFVLDHTRNSHQIHFFEHATEGCFGKACNVSLLECALRCHLHAMCRSFYFNKKSAACRYTLYIDSLMSMSDWAKSPTYWLRFIRPMWNSIPGE